MVGFLFNNIFKKIIREEGTSKSNDDLEKSLNSIKENMFYSQEMLGVGSWTHSMKSGETFLSDGSIRKYRSSFRWNRL